MDDKNKIVSKEEITRILQDLRVMARDIDDFHRQREIKQKIKRYENQLKENFQNTSDF